ncbi:MAG: ABC transporter substrate binding protein [Thermodesulfovibrionales bacterium]
MASILEEKVSRDSRAWHVLLIVFFSCIFFASPAEPADVIVIGDTQLTPVSHIVSGIREILDVPLKVYAPSSVKDRLREIIAKEEAKVVVALGRDALEEALRLPSSIPVIYGLVITPPAVKRPNTTGFYMATPVKEYVFVVRKYLPSIKRIAVVGSPDLVRTLEGTGDPQVTTHKVRNSFELVETVKQLDSADAILLLPDVTLLTSVALEEIYLFSFRRGIPILGISERDVRHGALFALVFDPVNVGRNIGENASSALKGIDIGRIPTSPPGKFELYLNVSTADKMGVPVSADFARKAKKVFPER